MRRAVPVLLQAGTAGLLRAEELERSFSFVGKSAEEIGSRVGEVAAERLAAFDAEKGLFTCLRPCSRSDEVETICPIQPLTAFPVA